MSTPETSEHSSNHSNPLTNILRFFIPAVILGIGTFFGIRALQANEASSSQESPAAPQGPPPSTVVVAAVRLLTTQDTQRVTGSIRAVSRAEVAAREDGAVIEINANEGDAVTKGQILVQLDPRRLDAQIAQAKAAITAANSVIEQREAEVKRFETDLAMKRKLYQQDAISESEFLDAEREATVSGTQEKSARDSLAAAGAALDLLEVRKQDLTIRAPFDARVVSRQGELGEWLRAGDPLLTLISSGEVEAWLQVPERYDVDLSREAITVSVGTAQHSATNLRPVPEADATNRVVTVIANIADPEDELVPGLSVSAELPVSVERPRLAVPSDAVVTTFAGPAIFRAQQSKEGLPFAERLNVTVLFQKEGTVFIEAEGLNEGDLVVIEGNERLFPMTPLVFTPPESESPEGAPTTNLVDESSSNHS